MACTPLFLSVLRFFLPQIYVTTHQTLHTSFICDGLFFSCAVHPIIHGILYFGATKKMSDTSLNQMNPLMQQVSSRPSLSSIQDNEVNNNCPNRKDIHISMIRNIRNVGLGNLLPWQKIEIDILCTRGGKLSVI